MTYWLAMRLALVFLLHTLPFACGGATTPQEPVVVAPHDDDAGAQGSTSSTEPSCIAGEIACGGSCTDPMSDPKHCGTCGSACADGRPCSNGACAVGDGG